MQTSAVGRNRLMSRKQEGTSKRSKWNTREKQRIVVGAAGAFEIQLACHKPTHWVLVHSKGYVTLTPLLEHSPHFEKKSHFSSSEPPAGHVPSPALSHCSSGFSLWLSQECSRMLWGLWCLASTPGHSAIRGRPCWCMNQCLIPSWLNEPLQGRDMLCLSIHLLLGI